MNANTTYLFSANYKGSRVSFFVSDLDAFLFANKEDSVCVFTESLEAGTFMVAKGELSSVTIDE
jgi:hypothetical protein